MVNCNDRCYRMILIVLCGCIYHSSTRFDRERIKMDDDDVIVFWISIFYFWVSLCLCHCLVVSFSYFQSIAVVWRLVFNLSIAPVGSRRFRFISVSFDMLLIFSRVCVWVFSRWFMIHCTMLFSADLMIEFHLVVKPGSSLLITCDLICICNLPGVLCFAWATLSESVWTLVDFV